MQEGKRRLNVIRENNNNDCVVEGTTCFAVQSRCKINCQRKSCQHWILHPESHNCIILAAQEGPHTLQRIGQIYGLTRMRICQIEKSIFEKIRQIS